MRTINYQNKARNEKKYKTHQHPQLKSFDYPQVKSQDQSVYQGCLQIVLLKTQDKCTQEDQTTHAMFNYAL